MGILSPKFRTALIAAGLALLATAAITAFIPGPWYDLCRRRMLPPLTPGAIQTQHLAMLCVPVYSFYIAAGLGAFLSSLVTLHVTNTRARLPISVFVRKLILFVALADIFSMWIGGYAVNFFWAKGDPVVLKDILYLYNPITPLLLGLILGNIVTKGFGVLITLPTVAWLLAARASRKSSTTI